MLCPTLGGKRHPADVDDARREASKVSTKEMLEVVRALHRQGDDEFSDDLVKACEWAMQKMPDEPATQGMLDVTIDRLVTVRDQREVMEQFKRLWEQYFGDDAYDDFIGNMTGEQVRAFVEEHPEQREAVAQLLWYRQEYNRVAADLTKLESEFRLKLNALLKASREESEYGDFP